MDIFNFIKSQLHIWDVVNDYTTLKKAGSYWKTRCPFHHEKTGSFTVSPEKNIFYCFGCHKGGDIITFITLIEQCSAQEAVHHLAEKYHIELPADEQKTSRTNKKRYTEICAEVAHWCHQHLHKNRMALAVLIERGLTLEIIQQFTIGYFPGGPQAMNQLLDHVRKKNILAQDLVEAQIVGQSKRTLYSPFEDRIIFPIKDPLGRFCGFGGRIFKPNDQRPKYVNSKENDHFLKGSLLFGLDVAKKSIQKNESVFLVEGYTDCIAMVQHGFINTVATLGTACSLAHLKLLSRFARELFVLYDSDEAGKKAVLRLTQLCWQADIELKVITLPASHDPASFLQAGNDLDPLVQKSKDIFMFFIESMSTGFARKRLGDKVQELRKLLEIIAHVEDSLKQDILLQRSASLLQVPFESLKSELARLTSSGSPTTSDEPSIESSGEEEMDFALEKRVFSAILNGIEEQKSTKATIQFLIGLMPEAYAAILQKICILGESKSSLTFTYFFDTLTNQEQQLVSSVLLASQPEDADQLSQLITQLYKKRWKKVVHELQVKIAQEKKSGNEEKVQQLLHEFLVLKKQLKNYVIDGVNR